MKLIHEITHKSNTYTNKPGNDIDYTWYTVNLGKKASDQ